MAGGKPDKEAKQAAKRARREASRARYKQIWQAFQMQRREDKALLPLMVGALLLSVAVFFVIGLFFGLQWILLPLGIAVGVLAAVSIFGRRVQRNVYSKADGQPGAAGWALDNLRGQWRVTPGVAGTTHLDAVHRVIGRPGIILVAEGAPHRVKGLLAQEKKRTARVVGKTPIYDIVVGNDEGQVPLSKLQRHLVRLPRNISAGEMDSLETRLAALGSRTAAMPSTSSGASQAPPTISPITRTSRTGARNAATISGTSFLSSRRCILNASRIWRRRAFDAARRSRAASFFAALSSWGLAGIRPGYGPPPTVRDGSVPPSG